MNALTRTLELAEAHVGLADDVNHAVQELEARLSVRLGRNLTDELRNRVYNCAGDFVDVVIHAVEEEVS